MRMPSELTSAELSKCYALSDSLLGLRECLPERLTVILDTFRADLLLEREDRARIETEARDRARVAKDSAGDAQAISGGPVAT
jgi:hypothetical protein